MTYHNIISTVDNEALRKHASELLYVVSCNKWSSNVILLGLLTNSIIQDTLKYKKAHIWNQTGWCSFNPLNLAFRRVNSSIPSKITYQLAQNSQIPSQAITRII